MTEPNPSLEERVYLLEKKYDELMQQHIYILEQYERIKKMFFRLSGVMRTIVEVDPKPEK